MKWSPERDAEMRTLAADGLNSTEVGKRMGLTRNAIISRGVKIGVRFPKAVAVTKVKAARPTPWCEANVALLRTCAAEGLSASQTAAKIGVSRNSAISKAWQLEIKFGTGGGKGNLNQRMQKPVAPGLSTKSHPRGGHMRSAASKPLPETVELILSNSVIRLADARLFQCRAVIGEVDGMDTKFCGAPVAKDSSWCPAHRARYVQNSQTTGKELARSLRRFA